MELNIPAIQGIGGSLIYLVDRYPGNGGNLAIYDVDFVPVEGARAASGGRGARRGRPPHAQRLRRAHGRVGAVLREALRLPRDPLLRHPGQEDGPHLARARRARAARSASRSTSPSDRKSADPGIPRRLPRARASSTSRSRRARHLRDGRGAARERSVRFLDTPDSYYERVDARVHEPRRGPRAAAGGTASSSTARASTRTGTRTSCCRSSPRR